MARSRIKVLFLIDSLKMGGAERITVSLLPYFDQVQPAVATIHDHESPLLKHAEGFSLFSLGAKRLLDPAAFARFLRLLDEEQFDVIHAQLQHATVFAALANRLRGIPVVITRHVINDDYRTLKHRWRVYAERLATRAGAARIIYVSQAALKSHQRVFSYPDHQRVVIYNGIEAERFQSSQTPQQARAALGLLSDAKTVTLIGVMRPGKGHSAAIALARAVPDLHLLLVGDGELSASLHEEAHGLTNVHFLGTREDIGEILAATSVLILPSESEALPTVLIEAAAASVPVVATNVGGVPEVVIDGETGFLLTPQDEAALIERVCFLLDNPEIAATMGENGRRLVFDRFTIQRQVSDLTSLYLDVHRSRSRQS